MTLRKPGFANRCALLPAHCSRWLARTGDPRITQITRPHFIVFELPVQLSSRESVGVASRHYITHNALSFRPMDGTKLRMDRATPIDFPGAWYHVLNRGIEKRLIFHSRRCYEKFLELLSTLPRRFGLKPHGWQNSRPADLERTWVALRRSTP